MTQLLAACPGGGGDSNAANVPATPDAGADQGSGSPPADGWVPDGGFGGYQNVMKQMNPGGRWTYGAATEMRKDGIALAY